MQMDPSLIVNVNYASVKDMLLSMVSLFTLM